MSLNDLNNNPISFPFHTIVKLRLSYTLNLERGEMIACCYITPFPTDLKL